MTESYRKSLSPLVKNKFTKASVNDADPSAEISDNILDQSDETSEVASQLTLIRKKHDKTKESNNKKRMYCEKLKLELEKANSSTVLTEMDAKSLQQKIDQLQFILENNRQKHEEEYLCKKSYIYMLDRMKKEKISMEIKANALQSSLKSSKHVLDAETHKFRKVRESQYQSRVMLQEIKHSLAYDQKRQNERLLQLEKNIKQRQELAFRREERQKRQAEISEAAANDDKDSQELKLRENLLLNRMWHIFLSKKYEEEKKKSADVEFAFQQIRLSTGLTDINDVVEKFLTREQTYTTLLNTVAEAENKLEVLKTQNTLAREQLKDNQFEESTSARKIYAEINEMEQKLCESYKEYGIAKEKMQKYVSTYDTVLNWGEKLFHNLEINEKLDISPGNKIADTKNSLEHMFEIIEEKISEVMIPLENSEDMKNNIKKLSMKRTQDIVDEISGIEGARLHEKKHISQPEDKSEQLNLIE